MAVTRDPRRGTVRGGSDPPRATGPPWERIARRVDAFQQSHGPIAFVFAVNKKGGDDNAGALVAQLAFVGFISVFPLLLLALTLLQVLAGSYPGFHHALDRSIVAQMPILGSQLVGHVAPLHKSNIVGFAVGVAGLAWGATGLSGAGMYTMAQIWSVPGADRPDFVHRLGRTGVFLVLLAVDVGATGFLAGFGAFGSHRILVGVASEAGSVLVNIAAYLGAFRVLTPRSVRSRQLLYGAIAGGIAWTILQGVGGYLVARDLRHDTALYGFFAYVLGLVAWIYLAARVFVLSAELNVVAAHRLWPRSIVTPPLTRADRQAIALQATASRRRAEEIVEVRWTDPVDSDRAASG